LEARSPRGYAYTAHMPVASRPSCYLPALRGWPFLSKEKQMTRLEQQVQLIKNCLKIAELHLEEIESGAFEERVLEKYEELKENKK
jgi:hypothetical protein